jgi:hypothetical protein
LKVALVDIAAYEKLVPQAEKKGVILGLENHWGLGLTVEGVGYRQLYTSSSYNLADSAYVVAEGLSPGAETNLIDCTPGSQPNESDDPDADAVYEILEDSPTRYVIRDKSPLSNGRFVRIKIMNPE